MNEFLKYLNIFNIYQNVKVEEKREPGGRLMFAYTSNDGYVNFCITSVPQRVKSASQKSIRNILKEFKNT